MLGKSLLGFLEVSRDYGFENLSVLRIYILHRSDRKKAPSVFKVQKVKKVSQHSLMEVASGERSKGEVKLHIRKEPSIEIDLSGCTQVCIKSSLQALYTLFV